jgi:hypothetical protein
MSNFAEIVEFPSEPSVGCPTGELGLSTVSLLDEIGAAFRRHLSLPDGAPEAIALWVLY